MSVLVAKFSPSPAFLPAGVEVNGSVNQENWKEDLDIVKCLCEGKDDYGCVSHVDKQAVVERGEH